MTLQEQLKEAQEKLGGFITSAREIGAKMRENPEQMSELQAPFDKAMADVNDKQQEVQNLESQINLEEMLKVDREVKSRALPQVPGTPDMDSLQELHRQALNRYIRAHREVKDAMEPARQVFIDAKVDERVMNALIEGDDALGGFTVPEDFRAEVIKATAGFTVVRQAGARVVPTSRNGITFPTINRGTDPYSSDLTTGDDNWKGEGYVTGGTAPTPQDKPTFGQERIPVHTWQPDPIELTMELLDDTAVPLDSILATLIGEVKGLDEDNAFLFGDGVGKPEGIAIAGAATVDLGPNSTVIAYDGLVDLYTTLPAQYRNNGVFIFNSNTLGALMKLEDGAGNPIFPANAPPGTLIQRPFYVSEFMPDFSETGATVCIIFMEARHYIIAERRDLTITRLVERYAPNVAILPTARVGGQFTMTDACKYGIGNA
jgi:HK97 family phage major capsid protein